MDPQSLKYKRFKKIKFNIAMCKSFKDQKYV